MAHRARFPGQWHVCVDPSDLTAMADIQSTKIRVLSALVTYRACRFSGATRMHLFSHDRCALRAGRKPVAKPHCAGHRETVLTALRMTAEIDAGPVYMKRPLSLEGTAQNIFQRAAELSMDMIGEIIEQEPAAPPQTGTPVFFKRRKPEQSEVPVRMRHRRRFMTTSECLMRPAIHMRFCATVHGSRDSRMRGSTATRSRRAFVSRNPNRTGLHETDTGPRGAFR